MSATFADEVEAWLAEQPSPPAVPVVEVVAHADPAALRAARLARARFPVLEWLDRNSITVGPVGHVLLLKAVGRDWRSGFGVIYEPGTSVTAADWDAESHPCGLFVAPSFDEAARYRPLAGGRFVLVEVAVDELACIRRADGCFDAGKAKCRTLRVVAEVVR